jgi:hypothetical protein
VKRPPVDGMEQDAFTRFHHLVIWRPGERKSIKRRANRRDRRKIRVQVRNETWKVS